MIGADGALTQRSISEEDLRWPSQIASPGSGVGEPIANQNFYMPIWQQDYYGLASLMTIQTGM